VVDLAADGTPTFRGAHLFEVEAGKGYTGEMLGFALSPDGKKIYIGSDEDGLWMGSSTDLVFQKKSSLVVQCLATRGNELWACSAAVSGFIAGVSTDDGATFTPKLPLIGTLAGPIACAAGTQPEGGAACNTGENSSQCGPAYTAFCATNGCQSPTGDAEGPVAAKSSSSCDVALVGGGGAAAFGAFVALGAVALQRRRKNR
jgi:hypothetical protein